MVLSYVTKVDVNTFIYTARFYVNGEKIKFTMAVSGKRAGDDVKLGSGIKSDLKLCEPCRDENVTTFADGVCRECKEYMCGTCFQQHLKARLCRKHVLVGLDSELVLDKNETCKQHENEIIKYFCRCHESVGCGDCMVLEHGDCKPDIIESFSKDFEEKEEFKNMVQQLGTLASAVEYSKGNLNFNKKTLKKMHIKALKDIREFKENIVKILEEMEATILDKANQLKSEHEELLYLFEKDLKALSTEIDRLNRKIGTENYRGKALFIRFIRNKSEVKALEKTLEQMKLKYNVNGFKFQPNLELLDSLPQNLNLGGFEIMLRSGELEVEEVEEDLNDDSKDEFIETGNMEI